MEQSCKPNTVIYKAVSLFLALIFMLSAIMSATFAWSDFSQHKTNAVSGKYIPQNYAVVLNKYEKDVNGNQTENPVKNARFNLYKTGGPDTEIASGLFTDSNGQIFADGLTPGDYYFEEVSPGSNYTYDKDGKGKEIKKYPFTITDSSQRVIVKVYNQRLSADLILTKTVKNADGVSLTNEQKDKKFAFTVTFDSLKDAPVTVLIDGAPKQLSIANYQLSIELKHGQTAVIKDLPVGILYRVTEAPAENYAATGNNHQGGIPKEGVTADFINTFGEENPSEPETELVVKKKVAGEIPQKDKDMEFAFTVIIDGAETKFTLKDGEEKIFALAYGAHYEVLEEDYTSLGYEQSSITNGYGTALGAVIEVVKTNTYTGTVKIEIGGEKKWIVPDSVTLPESITIYLKNGDKIVDTAVVKPDQNGKWEFTFTAPKYESDGRTVIQYTLEENQIESYRSTVDENNIITNTYIPPVVMDSLKVKKLITGDTPEKDAVFRFKLTSLNNAPMPSGSKNGLKVIDVTGAGENDFGEITYTKAGTYTYRITEMNDGISGYTYDSAVYTLTVVVSEENGRMVIKSKNLVKEGGNTDYGKAEFTNRHKKTTTPGKEKITISGFKIWNHGSNDPARYPQSITVYVKNGSNVVVQKQITAKEHWYWSFTLDKYDADGNEIKYTVDEAAVRGYIKVINGYNITNTYDPNSPDNPNNPGNPDKPGGDGPKTGDDSNIGLWFALMIISMAALIVTLLIGRKKRYVPKYMFRK